jgi:hypothetical protein
LSILKVTFSRKKIGLIKKAYISNSYDALNEKMLTGLRIREVPFALALRNQVAFVRESEETKKPSPAKGEGLVMKIFKS